MSSSLYKIWPIKSSKFLICIMVRIFEKIHRCHLAFNFCFGSKIVDYLCDQSQVVLPWFSSVFFWFVIGFVVIESAVIEIKTQVMMENIAPLHIFQIKKYLFK